MKTKDDKVPKKQIQPKYQFSLNGNNNRDTPRCLVAMPFSENWSDSVFSAIENVMHSIKINVYKVDTTERTSLKLLDDVINQIHEADIVVADLTNQNANVHIEIGMSMVLGKDLLAITQRKKDICADMGDHLYIEYTPDEAGLNELSRQLRLRIQGCMERALLEDETRKLKLQVIPEYKVTCFRDRSVAKLGEVFSKARKRIDILTTNLSWIFNIGKAAHGQDESYWDKIIESVKRSNSFQLRILTLNPESEIAAMRGKQLGFTPANFRDQLRDSLQKASASANEYSTNRVEIRLYDELPTQITFRVDDEIFTCIVGQPMQSRKYPVLRFETANLGVQEAFLSHFLAVWKDAGSPRL